MKTFQIITIAAATAAASLPTLISAQKQDDDITCSCSPNSYSFKLDFRGTCSQSINNPGTDGSICFFTQGGNPDDLDTDSLGAGALPPPTSNRRRLLGTTTNNGNNNEQKLMDRALSNVDFTKQLQHAQLYAGGFEQEKIDPQQRRQLQTDSLDTTPTTITSVTFLETDTTPELNIVNQDSTYFEIAGTNGQIITYESISAQLDPSKPLSKQEDDVPGGVILVLFGLNAANEVIQNRVAWGYTRNYCDGVPLNDDDAIGWVTLDSYDPPYSAFCEGVTDAPTPAPQEMIVTTSEATPVPPKPTPPKPDDDGGSKATKSPATKAEKLFTKSSKTSDTKAQKDGTGGDAAAKSDKTKGGGSSSKAVKEEGAYKVMPAKSSKTVDAKATAHSGDNTKSSGAAEKGSSSSGGSGKPAKGSDDSSSGGAKGTDNGKSSASNGSEKASMLKTKTGKEDTSSSGDDIKGADSKADKMSMPNGKATKGTWTCILLLSLMCRFVLITIPLLNFAYSFLRVSLLRYELPVVSV